MNKKIAVVGSGISGLTSAYLLSRKYQVTVIEADDRIGGHTATKTFQLNGKQHAIDTGFIVFNDKTYPNFRKLLSEIGVDYQKTSMGFSVSNRVSGLEYCGRGFDGFFAQRKNLFKLSHWRLLSDIKRFNKEALSDLESGAIGSDVILGDYLRSNGYSKGFTDDYLVPMGAAIWSATTDNMLAFPLAFFVRFFHNHGLLSLTNRPQWFTIKGGSQSYLEPLIASFKDNIILSSPVASIKRNDGKVTLFKNTGEQIAGEFDEVVIAAHSDQALAMFDEPTEEEMQLLSKIPYQDNEVVLHTDIRMLPRLKKTWSSWNYHINPESDGLSQLTYDMNILQRLKEEVEFCVTLNDTAAIDPEKIIGIYHYSHPVFTLDAVQAQEQWHTINGKKNTWFSGAWWGNGFHEDGVKSALKVAEALGVSW